MPWEEFKQLIVGIGPETPLGRIVQIRAENDTNRLKNFTPEQHRIRNEWRMRKMKKNPRAEADRDAMLMQLKDAFIKMGKQK